MAANFKQDGKVVQWTNGTGGAIASGQVVKINKILGVALMAIANGASGPVQIEGVFRVPKLSAAVIAMGESLTWDVSGANFDDQLATPATGDVTGPPAVAWEAAGNGVTTLLVKFTGVPGTVT